MIILLTVYEPKSIITMPNVGCGRNYHSGINRGRFIGRNEMETRSLRVTPRCDAANIIAGAKYCICYIINPPHSDIDVDTDTY